MHLHELEDRGAIVIRNPVVSLDLAATLDVGVEGLGTLIRTHQRLVICTCSRVPQTEASGDAPHWIRDVRLGALQRGMSSSVVPSTSSANMPDSPRAFG